MKLFFTIDLKFWGFCLVISFLSCFENIYAQDELKNTMLSYDNIEKTNDDAVGFLVINEPVNNTWSVLSPLADLLADEKIKVVVLYGIQTINGSMASSYLTGLQELRRAYNKPIIVYSDTVLSGAASYLMACGASAIVIAPWASVEGIEYSASAAFTSEKDKNEGKNLHYIYSGKFKDQNEHIAPKPEHIKRAELFIQSIFDNFVKDIIALRPTAGIYKDKWIKGESCNANEALTYGLIDGIADKTALISYVLNFAGLPNRNISNVDIIVRNPINDLSFEHKRTDQKSNIGILKIHALESFSWNYTQALLALFKDESIDKIILDIRLYDEHYATASSLYYDILKLKQFYKKPVVAYLEQAQSSGYYIASAADYIIASPGAIIGSIGTSYERWDLTQKKKNEHLKYLTLATGKYVDLFNENVPLDDEGRAIIQKQLNFDHAKIIQDIKVTRVALRNKDDSTWADGQPFIANDAFSLGLIDAVGNPLDALNYGSSVINNKVHELNFVFKAIN